ncbi:MAG: transposase [Candidatus Zixiibacteriota bacterium]
MSNIRRYHSEGNIYFITNVTHQRLPILVKHFDLLWKSIENTGRNIEFNMIAWIILPDHFHFVVDPCGHDISNIMQRMKMSFSSYYRSRCKMNFGRIWQNRFWDHIIRDDVDLNRHIDYVHINPVKHGYVQNPVDWQYSSFKDYVESGYYPEDWGHGKMVFKVGAFGE